MASSSPRMYRTTSYADRLDDEGLDHLLDESDDEQFKWEGRGYGFDGELGKAEKEREEQRRILAKAVKSGDVDKLRKLLKSVGPDDVVDLINEHDGKNYSALHYAAASNNVTTVKLLLKYGADVNSVGAACRQPLHLAAAASPPKESKKGDSPRKTSVVKLLLSKNANINSQDFLGRTPLHIAILHNNSTAEGVLLANDDIDINKFDHHRATPLVLACYYGRSDVAAVLIKLDAELSGIRGFDENMDTPLHIALRERHLKIAKCIVEKGIVNGNITSLLTESNRNCVEPIHEVVKGGHRDILKHVFKECSDVSDILNRWDRNADTPLHIATYCGQYEITKMMVKKGADLDSMNKDRRTPLHLACAGNFQTIAVLFVENGADLKASDDDGLAPLQVAANSKSLDTIVALLERLRNLDLQTAGGRNDCLGPKLLEWVAAENKADALQILLQHGTKLHGVKENDVLGYILDAASKGHTETVVALINWNREVLKKRDDRGRTPLHLAAEAGREATTNELLKARPHVDETDVNGFTALHCAAENGWVRTAEVLIRSKYDINKQTTDNQRTPLHLACGSGHFQMAKLLIFKEGADILLLDGDGENCLIQAIKGAHENVGRLLLSHEKWRDLMAITCLHPNSTDETTTPMRVLIEHMPDIAIYVMDRCISWQNKTRLEFDFELLDDTFSPWRLRPKTAEKDANDLHISTANGLEDHHVIRVASVSLEPNGLTNDGAHVSTDDNTPIDDEGVVPEGAHKDDDFPYEENGRLKKYAMPYTTKASEIRDAHPLNIMVSLKRGELLAHPLVTSLLHHKWTSNGRFFILLSLSFYLIFLLMLTGYVVVVPPSFYARSANTTTGVTWFADGEERWVEDGLTPEVIIFGLLGDWVVLVLSIINLLREFLQLKSYGLSYFNFGNLLEWVLYTLTVLFVLPLSDIQYITGIHIRMDWQWQCGAVAVFLAWINLILFVRRFAALGIYVIMLIDILRTFLKFVLILALFIVAFSMAFYMLLMNQEPFHRIQYSFAKTFVMMLGEVDFGDIFHDQNYLNTENTLAGGEEDFFLTNLFYEGITYTIFALFFVIMSILIMNMMVGLAVDDIHAIQQKAELHRLVMQAELVMTVQQALPMRIWRSAVICRKVIDMDEELTGLSKYYRAYRGYSQHVKKAIARAEETANMVDMSQEDDSNNRFFSDMTHRLKVMESKAAEECEKRNIELAEIRADQRLLRDRFNGVEKKLDSFLNALTDIMEGRAADAD
ncbi:transient receptor potential cation channel subfamily A member 1 homolog [Strongylocentrotus purpuratus]|uniref:Ion transport domain-containing protein n=1 Tax=Strongylocentrotus purpuratus TaxID=7668 RepID=A0A7M7RF00_STRPU|nr:transient receptor potential cation channel subfamily A member 1 homolog [Strongylocentrotus purpuratus]